MEQQQQQQQQTESKKGLTETARVVIEALKRRRIRIISVEGSIGAGKSRLMEALHAQICAQGLSAITAENRTPNPSPLRYLVVPEPIKSWTKQLYETQTLNRSDESDRRSILALFYSDMKRWGFLFQVKAFTSRLRLLCDQLARLDVEHCEEGKQIVVISERSLITDRIFFRNLYENSVVTAAEWEIYNEFYDTVTSDASTHHDVILYVDTPAQKCDERVKLRGREGEEDIPMQYMHDLHDQHRRMVTEFVQSGEKRQVIHVAFSDDLSQAQIDERAGTLLKEFTVLVAGG